jgi:hypothetical protein
VSFFKKATLCFLCAAFSFALPAFSAESAAEARKYALLIGINEYDGSQFVPLSGCHNDIRLMRDMLTQERFGFAEEDITVLLDEQATHTGILEAIDGLMDRAREDDVVYIHYSGHGSTTSGESGLRPTLVSYGARSGQTAGHGLDGYDILSDELRESLSRFSAKTRNIVFVADSCHSGTITRGGKNDAHATRGVPADSRPHPMAAAVSKPIEQITWVSIGSCQTDELSAEYTGDDGLTYGAFTWFWARALQSGGGDDTWPAAVERAKAMMSGGGVPQTPLPEGNFNRLVFGGLAGEIPKRFTVTYVSADSSEARVNAGTFAGVSEGSEFRLVKDGVVTDVRLIVQKAETYACDVKVEGGEAETGGAAVLTKWEPAFPSLKVAFKAALPSDEPVASELRKLFEADALSAYEPVDSPDRSNIVLWAVRPVIDADGNAVMEENSGLPKCAETEALQVWVMDPSQNYPYNRQDNLKITYDEKGRAVLAQNLERLARLYGLRNMSLPGGGDEALTIEYRLFVPASESEWETLPENERLKLTRGTPPLWKLSRVVPSDSPGFERRPDEGLLSVKADNRSARPYHIYAINATPDAMILPFLPESGHSVSTEVKPGQTVEFESHLLLTEDDEYVRVFATLRPINIHILAQKAIEGHQAGTRSAAAARPESDPIETVLRRQFYPETRGGPASPALTPADLISMGTRFTK